MVKAVDSSDKMLNQLLSNHRFKEQGLHYLEVELLNNQLQVAVYLAELPNKTQLLEAVCLEELQELLQQEIPEDSSVEQVSLKQELQLHLV